MWLKSLKNILHQSFPVVKVGKGRKNNILHEKIGKKSKLMMSIEKVKKSVEKDQNQKIHLILNFQEKIEKIEFEIANMISEQNALKIKKHYANMTECGFFNMTKMWKLKNQIMPEEK